jgi:hypothetical protein
LPKLFFWRNRNYKNNTLRNQRKGTNKMTTQTAAEKREDRQTALDILESVREQITNGHALLLINAELGKGTTDYFRALLTYTNKDGRTDYAHLTWAISKVFGYTLKDKNGFWCLAIGGGGFSKSDQIARSLANHYQIDRVRYERS